MKTASTLFHLLALSACLAARLLCGDMAMPGVRRAMQTMAGAGQAAATELLGQASPA
ncbi:hypothetical protein [Aminobacter sp. HY435]|uniref:hypothetical protein n=1 Tax=Aminobacter sp. HY435 TaxID=2970917 RepID=UPI0022B98715|nr:hypothetical protein [Aminobacter sp. HY435]